MYDTTTIACDGYFLVKGLLAESQHFLVHVFPAGGIHINNWRPVNDTTPPSRVEDFRTVRFNGSLFTLGWTTPGDDLNTGQGKNLIDELCCWI